MKKSILRLFLLPIQVSRLIGELLVLIFWIFPRVAFFQYQEEKKVITLFYKDKSFKKLDKDLLRRYRKKSPYKISKEFMQSQEKASSLHVYGETPLTVFHQIFQKGQLKNSDCFVDLGCGRGRGVLFASSYWNCFQTIGVDQILSFCHEAQNVADVHAISAQFFNEKLSRFNLSKGSFFYFYALCMEEDDLIFMISRLETVKLGSKVVTVSFPLTDYSKGFKLLDSWKARFPWGIGEVFLQTKC